MACRTVFGHVYSSAQTLPDRRDKLVIDLTQRDCTGVFIPVAPTDHPNELHSGAQCKVGAWAPMHAKIVIVAMMIHLTVSPGSPYGCQQDCCDA
jgi:hypothetical protein